MVVIRSSIQEERAETPVAILVRKRIVRNVVKEIVCNGRIKGKNVK